MSTRPQTWEVCDACDYALHRCHFCGEELTHAEALFKGCPHGCYREHGREVG